MFKSTGKLVYDPSMEDQKFVKPFWLMVACDEELARYYRQLLFKECCIKLNPRCLWGAHISVVRGEQPLSGWWGKDNGAVIEFEHDGIVKGNDEYFWIDVVCPKLSMIRTKYGLPPTPYFNFHLTIGNNVTQ